MSAIDISYYQQHPDFAQVRAAGVSLVIMKAGGGEGGRLYADSVYVANRAAARAVGLAVGSYFFNGPVDPTAAADFHMTIADWRPGDIIAIDVENNGSYTHWTPAMVFTWCSRIVAHGVPADRVLVYMSSSLLGAGWGSLVGLGVGLWVAQYGPNDGNPHSVPSSAPWPSWNLWQYTSAAGCPGVAGNVDTNQIAPSWASSSSILLEEDDMFSDADRQMLTGLNERTRQLEAAVLGLIDGVPTTLNPDVNFGQSVLYGLQEARKGVQAIVDKVPAVSSTGGTDLTPVLTAVENVSTLVKAIPVAPRTFVAQ